MLVKKPLFNFLPLCSLRLEWLDKLLLNHRGTEKPVRPCGSPTCTPALKQATRSVSPSPKGRG